MKQNREPRSSVFAIWFLFLVVFTIYTINLYMLLVIYKILTNVEFFSSCFCLDLIYTFIIIFVYMYIYTRIDTYICTPIFIYLNVYALCEKLRTLGFYNLFCSPKPKTCGLLLPPYVKIIWFLISEFGFYLIFFLNYASMNI